MVTQSSLLPKGWQCGQEGGCRPWPDLALLPPAPPGRGLVLCALMQRTLALASYLRLPSGPPGSGEDCPAGGLIAWTLALWSQAALHVGLRCRSAALASFPLPKPHPHPQAGSPPMLRRRGVGYTVGKGSTPGPLLGGASWSYCVWGEGRGGWR